MLVLLTMVVLSLFTQKMEQLYFPQMEEHPGNKEKSTTH